jgi:uncharacterized protein YjbJ (UPF0337 family)
MMTCWLSIRHLSCGNLWNHSSGARTKVNEAVGKATGNKARELKGDLQKAAGSVRKSYGDAKEQVKKQKR